MAALNLRCSARTSILRIAKQVTADDYSPDNVELENRLQILEHHYKRFVYNHFILVSEAQSTEMNAHEDLFAMVEDVYSQSCMMLRRKMKDVKSDADDEFCVLR